MGIRTVMITGDNPLTAKAIADEAGVDDFLAEATPEDKMALIRREQAAGRLVAMTGDGTNDAPALAQADVGVAMNTGTQAAKEAGNMVDLDSNPTKLIEIVEIGKQLLITRGSLTTFSIANDVAKYFAIIPAMFAGTFPVARPAQRDGPLEPADGDPLRRRSSTRSSSSRSIPLALRGVRYRPVGAAALLRRNLLIYGVGGVVAPFVGIKLDRPRPHRTRESTDAPPARPRRSSRSSSFTRPRRRRSIRSPSRASSQVAFGDRADGSLVERDGVVVGSSLLGQSFADEQYVPPAPVGRRRRLRRRRELGVEPRPDEPRPPRPRSSERVAAYRELNGLADERDRPRGRRDRLGLGARPGHLARQRQAPGAPRRTARAGSTLDARARARRRAHATAARSGSWGSRGVNVLALNLALDAER